MFEIRLLGTPEFAYSGTPYRFSAPPRTLPLLAWILLHRRAPLAREAVAFAFWPDSAEEEARGDLRRHLYYLTKALPPRNGEPWFVADKKTIAWNERSSATFDVAEFERLCADDATLDSAVALYRGPLLDGCDDEWIEPERERLKGLAENALLRLIARDAEPAPQRAIAYAQHLLRIDPWREDAIRTLVELRHRSGDRAGAMREYREFAERLRAELDVAPMPETTAVFEAVAHGNAPLPARAAPAPAPATPAAPRTNLPARSDASIGRERALADVRALLETTRIATLAGTGGVGKTRLAIDAGWAVAAAYSDGVWYADCAPLADPSLVVGSLAAALGVARATERPELATLVSALRRKRVLIVIDNCEHVIAEVARVASELLAGCADARFLCTSREPLAIRGERVYRVPSLDVPPDFEAQTPASARAFGAVALFEARASAVAPSFAIDAANVSTIVDICRRLDGIALAIELAAARVTLLSPSELARRLEERFRLLTGGERTALPRQRTMRALIDWSWDLCSEHERVLLRRLAIFAGGFSLAAAEGVCFDDPLDAADAVELCAALVEKSLLVAEPLAEGSRYRLLESIREYGLERLADERERAPLARRHAEYFAAFGANVDASYQATPDASWHARATAELDNVRAALGWALGDGGDAYLGAELASAYGTVWEYGSSRADRYWLDRAYERLDRGAHPALTARLLWQIASISRADGRHAAWVGVAVRDAGDARTRADALCWLADNAVRRGLTDDAAAALAEAASLADPSRPKAHASLLRVRGEFAARGGDYTAANELLERSISTGTACGASAVVAAARVALAEVAFAAGDVERAVAAAALARATIADTFGRTAALADAAANLAAYRIANDAFGAARDDAREALSIARDLDFPARIVIAVEYLATVAGLEGEVERAAFLLGFTEAERRRREMARGTTELGGYERLFARLRAGFDEDELARRLSGGAVAGMDRAVSDALNF